METYPVAFADVSIRISSMVIRVQHVDGEYRVVLSPEVMEALHLSNGTEVEVRPVVSAHNPSAVENASIEEAIAAFRETEPEHQNSYRELAK